MSTGAIPPSAEESLLIAALIGLVLLRRAIAQLRGTPVSTGRLLGYAVFYGLLFALVAGVESLPILPLWSLGADIAAAAVGTWVAVGYVERTVTIYQEGGRSMYRLGLLVPIAYLALFLGRLLLEIAIGVDPFASASTFLSPGAAAVLEAVDALFGFSTGLAIGRNIGVYRAWQRFLAPPARGPPGSEHS
jgi:hypothetical protein